MKISTLRSIIVPASLLGGALLQAAHVNPGVVATIALNGYPQCVGVNPATNRIYVHHWQPSAVSVIDGETNAIIARIPVDGYSWPECIGVNPVTNRIYVALTFNSSNYIHSGVDALVVVDGATNEVIATTDVGRGATSVGVNPETNRVYVSNFYGSSVTVIDGATNTAIATVPVGSRPATAAVNPVTNRIYVASADTSALWVIDGTTNTVMTTIPYDSSTGIPIGADVNPMTNLVYVTHWQTNKISVVDGGTHAILGTMPVPIPVDNVRVNELTNHLYISTWGYSDTVAVVDASRMTVLGTVRTGSGAQPLAVNSVTDKVYVGNFFARTLSILGEGHAPVAVPDSYTTVQGNTLTIPTSAGVLTNDMDPDPGTILRAVLVSGPTHGSLTLWTSGAFTYVPDATFSGTDSFTYRATDGTLVSEAVTVTLNVTSLGDFIDEQPGPTDGQKATLQDKLDLARQLFESGNQEGACGLLNAFIMQVEGLTPMKLSEDAATALINGANALKSSSGCP